MNDEGRSEIIFYEGKDNGLRIKTLIENETIWLTQQQLANHSYFFKFFNV